MQNQKKTSQNDICFFCAPFLLRQFHRLVGLIEKLLILNINIYNMASLIILKDIYREYLFRITIRSEVAFYKKLQPSILLKQRFWHRCCPVNWAKFLTKIFSLCTLSNDIISRLLSKYLTEEKIGPNFSRRLYNATKRPL